MNDAKPVILSGIKSFTLLATIGSPLVELVKAFNFSVLRFVAPNALTRILELVDLGLARTFLVTLVIFILIVVLVVLQSILALAYRVVKVIMTVAAGTFILGNIVHVVIRLWFESGLSLIFKLLL